MKPIFLPGRRFYLILTALLAVLPACVMRSLETCVDNITQDLVERLQRHEDVNSLRILVLGFHRTDEHNPWMGSTGEEAAHEEGDHLAILLGHEFVIALSSLTNVVESEYAPVVDDSSPGDLAGLARRFEVDAVLVGDYTVQDRTVVISARVVDAESAVILAAAKGTIRVSQLDLDIE